MPPISVKNLPLKCTTLSVTKLPVWMPSTHLLCLPCLTEWLLPNLQSNNATKLFVQPFVWRAILPVWPKNFTHAVLFGLTEYQGISVKSSYFLQGIIYIIAFLNEAACNSSTSELLCANAFFWSKWEFHSLLLPPSTMRRRLLPTWLPDGTSRSGDSYQILFTSWKSPKIMLTSHFYARKMSTLCEPSSTAVSKCWSKIP